MLQDLFNSGGMEIHRGQERAFRIGDKVMQLRNNYDKDVFNGDQGTVVSGRDDGGCVVEFDGREIVYETREMTELTLAYAMTIHKAQGSEAKAVIQVLSTSHYIMLSRSLLYTGVTRARERCVLIGELAAVRQAIGNNKVARRNTYLCSLLLALDARHRKVA